ncbi:MAG: cyclic nucleotide-binding domain-containing protein [Solirubrobacterales bacterium]
MADAQESLARVPLFSGIDRKSLKQLAKLMRERTFTEGETVAAEGQSGVGFFLIEEGNATVSVAGETVRTLVPGDYFGEVALIDEGPRSATVVAATDLRCLGMSAWEFRPFVQEHPEVTWALLVALASRLRETQARAAG